MIYYNLSIIHCLIDIQPIIKCDLNYNNNDNNSIYCNIKKVLAQKPTGSSTFWASTMITKYFFQFCVLFQL